MREPALQEEITVNATLPQTLLQMRGLAIAPARLSQSALVIIDAQGEYRSGRMTLPGIDPALSRIADVLARARAAGTPVLHVAQIGQAGTLFDPGTERGAILPQAAPVAGEPVVMKRLPNAFAGTELHERLQHAGRNALIVAGFMTHMCISASVRTALDLGYQTTVIADATATRALPSHDGGMAISSDAVHRTALAELADRFAAVVASAEIAA
jgi:nicotinamidase-related amidase